MEMIWHKTIGNKFNQCFTLILEVIKNIISSLSWKSEKTRKTNWRGSKSIEINYLQRSNKCPPVCKSRTVVNPSIENMIDFICNKRNRSPGHKSRITDFPRFVKYPTSQVSRIDFPIKNKLYWVYDWFDGFVEKDEENCRSL